MNKIIFHIGLIPAWGSKETTIIRKTHLTLGLGEKTLIRNKTDFKDKIFISDKQFIAMFGSLQIVSRKVFTR